MRIEDIEYDVPGTDEPRMVGYLADDTERGPGRPAVLLAHEGPGLDDHVRGRARRLAEMGYVAFALDYNGGGRVLPMADVFARIGTLREDPARVRALGSAGLGVLLAQPNVDPARVAAIGYCFGGAIALELARTGADVKAVVGFHSSLPTATIEDDQRIVGRILMCMGTDDPLVGAEDRAAFENGMRAAAVPGWTMELYGNVGHSFTNPAADALGLPGVKFDERADRRSWRSMMDLFDETIGRP
jgi:dienelactone hydrolase